MTQQLPQFLLDVLACPKCRGPLQTEEAAFRCDTCHLRYRIDEAGVPDFLIDNAEPAEPAR